MATGSWVRVLMVAAAFGYLQQALPQQGTPAAAPPPPVVTQHAFLEKYCFTCHSDELRTAGLSLEGLDLAKVPANAETWEKVLRKLHAGSMPPQGMPRPDSAALE